MEEIITALTTERQVQGLSLKQVAKKANVTFGCIGHWELGRRFPRTTELQRWAEALGYEVVYSLEKI